MKWRNRASEDLSDRPPIGRVYIEAVENDTVVYSYSPSPELLEKMSKGIDNG